MVNLHPLKELQNYIVMLSSVCGIFYGVPWKKTYRFMVRHSVSNTIQLRQLVKNIGVVILNCWS